MDGTTTIGPEWQLKHKSIYLSGDLGWLMHVVNADIERPPANLIDRLTGTPAAVVSDVTGDEARTMSARIKPVITAPMTAGSAFTVKTRPADNLMIHKAITLAGPGDILVIDAEGHSEAGLVGELIATSCKVRQLNGIIVDGAVRDIDELEQLGFPVFSSAVSPHGSSKKHPGSINVPVSCGDISVRPGDLIVGDTDGVVAIDPDHASDVIAAANAKLEQESALKERIEAGETIFEIAELGETFDQFDFS